MTTPPSCDSLRSHLADGSTVYSLQAVLGGRAAKADPVEINAPNIIRLVP
jgi:hypothetical protein